jgi:hypothetical protein
MPEGNSADFFLSIRKLKVDQTIESEYRRQTSRFLLEASDYMNENSDQTNETYITTIIPCIWDGGQYPVNLMDPNFMSFQVSGLVLFYCTVIFT